MQLLMNALVLAAVQTPMNAATLAWDEMPFRRFMAGFAQSRLPVAGLATIVPIALAAVVAPWIEMRRLRGKRVAIVLLHRPELISADEPATALVGITYDLPVIAGHADHITVMHAGRIVEKGSVDRVLDHPLHAYTRGLIGSLPSRTKRGGRLRGIPGMTPGALNPQAGRACHLNDR